MDASRDLAGSEIGRYRIVSLIGKGGMGEVYDAIDSSLGRHVALKILDMHAVSDPRRVSRFVQEARSASALNHPHVVAVYEVGEADGLHFIAMEKIDGVTLRELLAAGRLPLRRAIELMTQIAGAVAAAHDAGIIHRDLKPENMMVSRSGYAKVLDFGLAKLQPEAFLSDDASGTQVKSTDSGTVLGTVGYMSPEQAQGKPLDRRTDIFSLGCIVYETVTGHRAFRGASPVETLHKIIHEEPLPLGDLAPNAPQELQWIVNKALAKDPEQRYQSAREMALDLQNVERKSVPVAPGATRRGWVLAAAGAAAILAAVTGGVYVSRRAPAVAKSSLQVKRLTTSGDVIAATISPDAKYMAYIRYNERGQSLWLRQLANNQDLGLIVPPASRGLNFWGVTFTNDSSTVFYVTKSETDPLGTLYRMPVIGGRGEALLTGIDSPVAFSRDGARIAYLRRDFPKSMESALMVASSDGSGAHPIAIKRPPEYFSPIWFAAPSWSPDGSLVATALARRTTSERSAIVLVNARDGSERALADGLWSHIGRTTWLPDGTAIVTVAGNEDLDDPLWLVPVDGGQPRPITHDADVYRGPNLNAKGDVMMGVRNMLPIAEVWAVPLGNGQPQKVGESDPWSGLSYLPNGQIAVSMNGIISAAGMSDDGVVHTTELVHDRFRNYYPLGFAGGIVYASSAPEGVQMCITDSAGGARKIIGSGFPLAISRDGSKLLISREHGIWLRTLATGQESKVLDLPVSEIRAEINPSAALSPDGGRVAIVAGPFLHRELMVISASDGKVLWTVPANGEFIFLRWTPDGSTLLVAGAGSDLANVYKIDEHGLSSKLTNFYGQRALAFDISPDGKTLAVVRSQWQRDAVLITGFR